MTYPEVLIAPMREELTRLGIEETRTPEQVRAALRRSGTLLVVVNSVCGCAAGKARPGVAAALRHVPRPDAAITVFAGADLEATEEARRHFAPYPPSSPQIALFKDGRLVYMLERHQIEGRMAGDIAASLTAAFDEHCRAAQAV
ncbi:MAG TPA: BrxA/BrxB family bacilliredoxin [Terriglobales bacterium]|nr:BrxA/BrxB family bacilliredoxin [Terriglobales bacterium]